MSDCEQQIQVGMLFKIHGAEMEVTYEDPDFVRYSARAGGDPGKVPRARLIEKLSSGAWEVVFRPPAKNGPNRSAMTLSEAELAASARRRKYILGVRRRLGNRWPNRALREVIATIATELEDLSPPHPSTVREWVKLSIVVGNDTATLAGENHKKGCYSRFTVEAERAISNALQKWYLTSERLSVKDVRDFMIAELANSDRLERLFPRGVPSVRTLQHRAEKLDGFEKVATRYGMRKARRMFRASGQSEWVTHPLALVQADGQLGDILVVPEDADGKPIMEPAPEDTTTYRPYITVLFDCYARAVLACVITAAPFSTCTVLLALKAAVVKDGDKPRGVPEVLSIDNGSDYISDGIKRAARRFGIEIIYSEPYRPDGKAFVERFIQELTRFIHTIPGTTFSSPAERGEYKSEQLACVTLTRLRELVTEFIEIYHLRVHGTTKRAPRELWLEATVQHPPRVVPAEEADAVARVPHRAVICSGRVTVNELEWYSHAATFHEQSLRAKGLQPLVDVMIDDFNLGTVNIQTLDGEHNTFLAKSTKPRYADGLTMFEHQRIRAELKTAGKRDVTRIGEIELAKRKLALRESIRELAKQGKRAARKAARLREAVAKDRPSKLAIPDALARLDDLPERIDLSRIRAADAPAPPPPSEMPCQEVAAQPIDQPRPTPMPPVTLPAPPPPSPRRALRTMTVLSNP